MYRSNIKSGYLVLLAIIIVYAYHLDLIIPSSLYADAPH